MAEAMRNETPMSQRLAAAMSYIVDEFHASGHVGAWCASHCLPSLPENQALLRGFPNPEVMPGFPTSICEVVNSELSPLGHTVHHQGRWVCQLIVHEVVDVHNMKRVRETQARAAVAERKAAVAARKAKKAGAREAAPVPGLAQQ